MHLFGKGHLDRVGMGYGQTPRRPIFAGHVHHAPVREMMHSQSSHLLQRAVYIYKGGECGARVGKKPSGLLGALAVGDIMKSRHGCHDLARLILDRPCVHADCQPRAVAADDPNFLVPDHFAQSHGSYQGPLFCLVMGTVVMDAGERHQVIIVFQPVPRLENAVNDPVSFMVAQEQPACAGVGDENSGRDLAEDRFRERMPGFEFFQQLVSLILESLLLGHVKTRADVPPESAIIREPGHTAFEHPAVLAVLAT